MTFFVYMDESTAMMKNDRILLVRKCARNFFLSRGEKGGRAPSVVLLFAYGSWAGPDVCVGYLPR